MLTAIPGAKGGAETVAPGRVFVGIPRTPSIGFLRKRAGADGAPSAGHRGNGSQSQ